MITEMAVQTTNGRALGAASDRPLTVAVAVPECRLCFRFRARLGGGSEARRPTNPNDWRKAEVYARSGEYPACRAPVAPALRHRRVAGGGRASVCPGPVALRTGVWCCARGLCCGGAGR